MVTYTRDDYELEVSSRDFLRSVIVSSKGDSEGVLNGILELFRKYGITKGRIGINSGVPPGSGLGSSSALMNAILKILYKTEGKDSGPDDLAGDAFNLESDYFGIVLGKQDPYAISNGGLKLMEFMGGSVKTSKFDLENETAVELEKRILLVYTGSTRESSSVLRKQVTLSQEERSPVIEILHSIRETALMMNRALHNNDLKEFSELVNRGWELKKAMNPDVSTDHIDQMIDRAMKSGASSARLMGGGKEGFILLLSEPEKMKYLQKEMMGLSSFAIRISFDPAGTRLIRSF
jgi:D-glycero-alpha-D-manno-heptose-7-phosphate kinase